MDDFEAFYRELDRRYGLSLIPRVRLGTVTAAASPTSYSITLPGESNDRAAVPSVCPMPPQVGDLVRVELVADHPVIVDVLTRPAPVQADVTTGETTTSTSFVDLATSGPAVTVDLVTGQHALILVSFKGNNASGAGHAALMSFAVSGAETIAAADGDGAENDNSVTATITRATVFTAAAGGAHTFTAKYRTVVSGTSTFATRRIIAVPY